MVEIFFISNEAKPYHPKYLVGPVSIKLRFKKKLKKIKRKSLSFKTVNDAYILRRFE